MRYVTLATVAVFVAGCGQQPAAPAPTKHVIVFGASNATPDEAANEAQGAISNASRAGYRAISVGGGAGAAAGQSETSSAAGAVYTVFVLLEGPVNAPDLLPATGKPVP